MKRLSTPAASPVISIALSALFLLLVIVPFLYSDNPGEIVSARDSRSFFSGSVDKSAIQEGSVAREISTRNALRNADREENLSQQLLYGEEVPLASSGSASGAADVQEDADEHSGFWSLGNNILSVIAFMEALTALILFLFQTKESNPDPFTKRLILKMLAFGAALVCLVITGSTSDLSQPFVIFDGASTAVVIFFLAVQLMLFYSRKEPVPVETSVDPGVHFRAKRRYEA